jgi:hypothetical protein
MAAACLITLPGGQKEPRDAWPLRQKAQIDAWVEKDELAEQERLDARTGLNKAARVVEHFNELGINYFNTKLLPIKWQDITEEKFVEVASETERFITRYMTMVDQLEYALHQANKLKMWIFKEIELLEDANKTVEIWMDQMRQLRKWQTDNFGQV